MFSLSCSILATLVLRTFGATLCAKIVGTASTLTSRRLLNLLPINLFCRSTRFHRNNEAQNEQNKGEDPLADCPLLSLWHSITFCSIHPQVVLNEMKSKDLSSWTSYYGQQHNNEAFFCRSFFLAALQRSVLPAMLKTSTTY